MLSLRYLRFLLAGFLLVSVACESDPVLPPDTEEKLLTEPIQVSLGAANIAPLTAIALIRTEVPTTVSIEIKGDIPVNKDFPEAQVHSLPILGLYPDTDNQVVVNINSVGDDRTYEETLSIQTESLPFYMPNIEILTAKTDQMEPGWNLCELNIGGEGVLRTRPIIFDENGVIRWFMILDFTGNWTSPIRRSQDGNWLFSEGPDIFENNMNGLRTNTWQLQGFNQHHDLFEKADGNFLVPTGKWGIDSGLDHIVEYNRTMGAITNIWDLRESLDPERYDFLYNRWDWIHVNAVIYDEDDEAILVSGRHQGVTKFSRDNELIWILSPHKGWDKNGKGEDVTDRLLVAVDPSGTPYPEDVQQGLTNASDFSWPWGQHAPLILPNGNIFMFDNGFIKNFTLVPEGTGSSRGVEYEIDEVNKTVKQVCEFGADLGAAFYSSGISDVDYLPQTQNRYLVSGNIFGAGKHHARIIEVSHPDKEVVFDAKITFKNGLYTGRGWSEADLIYRGERLSIYP